MTDFMNKLNKEREKYEKKAQYFDKIGFDNLKADFQCIVNLIDEMIAENSPKDNILNEEESKDEV